MAVGNPRVYARVWGFQEEIVWGKAVLAGRVGPLSLCSRLLRPSHAGVTLSHSHGTEVRRAFSTPRPPNNTVPKEYGPNGRVRWTRHSLGTGGGG